MFRIRVQLQYLWLGWSEYMFRIRVQLQYLWLVWSKYMFRIRVQLQYLWLIWSPGQGLNWTRLLLLLQPRNWTSPGGKLSIVILMEFSIPRFYGSYCNFKPENYIYFFLYYLITNIDYGATWPAHLPVILPVYQATRLNIK